jgi:alkylation response protein AidB-like acyl-CoA dehydrogenase
VTAVGTAVTRAPTLIDRRNLAFLLYEWLDVERLTGRGRYAGHSREEFDDILELAERIARDRFAPHNRAADEREPHVHDGQVVLVDGVGAALRAFFDSGLAGAGMDEAVGGMALPHVISMASFAFFQAANSATAGYAMLTVAAANLLIANGSPEQIDRFVPALIAGRFFGTMCLSETQAGSSLADIATRAIPQDDGSYRLFGSKMWISGGEHQLAENIIHLVLAKIPGGPTGTKGISLFVVPRALVQADGSQGERNDVVLAGLNHKMGSRGTVNTVLTFGEGEFTPGGQPGAVGHVVGEPHRGLAYMFHMMNEARVEVGLGAAALGSVGYLKALRYARERPQGRRRQERDPSSRQAPIIEHADVRRMLVAQKSYVEGALGLLLYCARLVDDELTLETAGGRADAHLLLELLTPIAKSWPSQWCLEANSLAIQVHGGYGYARDYEVEQHYRDNRLNAIHEGTHGIQALDLLGRKVTMQNGRAVSLLADAVNATIARARDRGGELAEHGRALAGSLQRLLGVTETLSARQSDEVEAALANATIYLEAAGHIVVGWIWLEQLLAVGDSTGAFYDGKRAAGRFFYRYELPKTGPQLDLLARVDRTVLDTEPAWL